MPAGTYREIFGETLHDAHYERVNPIHFVVEKSGLFLFLRPHDSHSHENEAEESYRWSYYYAACAENVRVELP